MNVSSGTGSPGCPGQIPQSHKMVVSVCVLQKKRQCCNDCLCMQYNTLPPFQLFNYQILTLVHKRLYSPDSIPSIFWNNFTRNTSIHSYNTRHNNLCLSQVNSSFGGRLLKFKTVNYGIDYQRILLRLLHLDYLKILRYYLTYKPL